MRIRRHPFKATVAAGLSLWIAAVACLLGCTLPVFANLNSITAYSMHENSPSQNQPDLMANMEIALIIPARMFRRSKIMASRSRPAGCRAVQWK